MTYATDAELIAYAAARGVTIAALESPILLTKAGTKVLFRTITTGTITGTFEIQTYVNYFVQPI